MSISLNLKKAKMGLNLLTNIFAFAISFAISFYISPLVVSKFGADAYGFINLSNEIVSYVTIIAVIFNSVGSRFITNEYCKGNKEEAKEYFNALIAANLLISIVIIVFGIVFIPLVEYFISVPSQLVNLVKLVFAISFMTYAISLTTSTFSTATFVKNVTAINGVISTGIYIIRFAIIIILLNIVSMQLYWVPFASLVSTVIGGLAYIITAKRILPEIFPNPLKAKPHYIRILAKSGIWMSASSLGAILLRNVDLLIANQSIGSVEMGYLSIARTLPNSITSVLAIIGPLFIPLLVQKYSQNDKDGLGVTTSRSIDIVYLIMLVPICGFIVLSKDFITLWQKELSVDVVTLIGNISAITAFQALFNSSGCVNSQLSIVTNKLKIPVFVTLGCGILNVCLTLLLLKITNLGLIAIAISGTFVMIFRYVFFNPVYGAIVIGQPWSYFYKRLFRDWLLIPILLLGFNFLKLLFYIDSWSKFTFVVGIFGICGYVVVVGYFKFFNLRINNNRTNRHKSLF